MLNYYHRCYVYGEITYFNKRSQRDNFHQLCVFASWTLLSPARVINFIDILRWIGKAESISSLQPSM